VILLGILGYIGINYNKLVQYFRESVEVQIYLKENTAEKDRNALRAKLETMPYTRTLKYSDKETAKADLLKTGEKDFAEFIDNNPLPTSFSLTLKNQYVQVDSLAKIKEEILANSIISDITYPTAVIKKLNANVRIASIILFSFAIVLAIIVIFLIDNTTRLAMFSNRFLIKTMQMVGATRGFISKPMNIRAAINGAIAAGIAIAALLTAILVLESLLPEIKTLHDNVSLFILFFLILILGVAITLLSTQRSVVKYLKMKLDDLY
jgi:cell division transport system permease protein